MVPLECAASIVVLEFERSYGLGFVSPNGSIVTSFHVIADEPRASVHFADGSTFEVRSIFGVDREKDLAVLKIDAHGSIPVRFADRRLAAEGDRVFVFGMSLDAGRLRWAEARISAVQVLSSSVTLYQIDGPVPSDAAGSPLLGTDGKVLGVMTFAQSDQGVKALSVPWRYVEPLFNVDEALPLASLSKESKGEIPDLPLALFQSSTVSGLEATVQSLAGVLRLGDLDHNRRDAKQCFRLYLETARQILAERRDCPGVQAALRMGIAHAASLGQTELQASALKDAFETVLQLIERHLRFRDHDSAEIIVNSSVPN